jgi:hypothetical protein
MNPVGGTGGGGVGGGLGGGGLGGGRGLGGGGGGGGLGGGGRGGGLGLGGGGDDTYVLSVAMEQLYGKPVTPAQAPPSPLISVQFGNGGPRQELAPLMVHESMSEKHSPPSAFGFAFSWYDVGHIQVEPLGPARPPAQKLLSLTQRYCTGVSDVLSQATPRSAGS